MKLSDRLFINLEFATFCVDCSVIGNNKVECSACGSRSLFAVASVLNRANTTHQAHVKRPLTRIRDLAGEGLSGEYQGESILEDIVVICEDSCDHNIALNSYCNACAQTVKLDEPEPPEPVTWREAALVSLLKQAEANRRILYLESVLADIEEKSNVVCDRYNLPSY